jgi:hypothetical protein
MKTACFIYSDNPKYDKLQECAVNSFKKFHPDIDTYVFTSKNKEMLEINNAAYKKYLFAFALSKELQIKKIIILGADTITCGRLDEFLNDNYTDILTTLDYPYPLRIASVPIEEVKNGKIKSLFCLALSLSNQDHVNADVVCFNNIEALEETILCSKWMVNEYHEQGALNYICNIQNKYTSKIVDGDYENSDVVYNARSKGNNNIRIGEKPWYKYTNLFKVQNGKLYTSTHEYCSKSKQIKMWHYIEGFGCQINEVFEKNVNSWIDEGFNQQTKDFFTNECNCGNFFKQKFTI